MINVEPSYNEKYRLLFVAAVTSSTFRLMCVRIFLAPVTPITSNVVLAMRLPDVFVGNELAFVMLFEPVGPILVWANIPIGKRL